MGAAESLEILYKIINEVQGPKMAKEVTLCAIDNILFDIQDEGLTVTAKEIENRLSKIANDYIQVSKNNAA